MRLACRFVFAELQRRQKASWTIELTPDSEGQVVATLVSRKRGAPTDKAVLYVHGYVDYFFNTDLAEAYNAHGLDFYAIDLRKYGRSLLPHQSPNFALSLEEYFEDLDAAIDRIRDRDGHSFVLLNGHSTGGLTASLYADARRGAGTVDAIFLNSPWFDMNASWFDEHVLISVASAVGYVAPGLVIRSGFSPLYGQSLHRDYFGEWDYRLDWKPNEGFPVKAGWVRAIKAGHVTLQSELQINAPALVMFSTESSWPKTFDSILYRTDAVLDVADIDRFADGIGRDVTKIRIPSGVHDLVLSAKAVRENVYHELFDWIRSRGWLEDDRGQSRINPVQSGAA